MLLEISSGTEKTRTEDASGVRAGDGNELVDSDSTSDNAMSVQNAHPILL